MVMTANRMPFALFLFFSLLYLAVVNFIQYPINTLIKPIPIYCLIYIAAHARLQENLKKLLLAALIFSAFGDIALTLPIKLQMEAGLGMFLIAQCFYLSLFARSLSFSATRVGFSLAVIAFSGGAFYFLANHLHELFIPVIVYMGVITLMTCSAILGRNNHYLVAIGAFTFMVSDTLIALNEFVYPGANFTFAYMLTYYGAQLFIVLGVTHEQNRRHFS